MQSVGRDIQSFSFLFFFRKFHHHGVLLVGPNKYCYFYFTLQSICSILIIYLYIFCFYDLILMQTHLSSWVKSYRLDLFDLYPWREYLPKRFTACDIMRSSLITRFPSLNLQKDYCQNLPNLTTRELVLNVGSLWALCPYAPMRAFLYPRGVLTNPARVLEFTWIMLSCLFLNE